MGRNAEPARRFGALAHLERVTRTCVDASAGGRASASSVSSTSKTDGRRRETRSRFSRVAGRKQVLDRAAEKSCELSRILDSDGPVALSGDGR